MSTFIQKFRLLFLPVIGLSICVIIGYSVLCWLLFIQLNLFQLPDVWTYAVIPFLLPLAIVGLTLRNRLSAIPSKGRNSPIVFFFVILCFLTFIPTCALWVYTSSATGKLTVVNNISELDQRPPTMYCKAKHAFIVYGWVYCIRVNVAERLMIAPGMLAGRLS